MRIWEARKHTDPDKDPEHCFVGRLTSFFKDNMLFRSHKTINIMVYLNFLLVDRMICTNNNGSGSQKPKKYCQQKCFETDTGITPKYYILQFSLQVYGIA